MRNIIVTKNGDKLTIYPFTPDKELVRDYRKKGMKQIQKGDRFFASRSKMLGKFYDATSMDDLILAQDLDYKIYHEEQDTREEYSMGFCLLHYDDNENCYDAFVDGRIGWGEYHPFRIEGLNEKGPNKIDYFIPIGSRRSNTIHGILHIPRCLYFEQLFRSNKCGMLAGSNISDEQLAQIIDLNTFKKPIEVDEHQLELFNRLREVVTPNEAKKDFVQELAEQAEKDKELVARVGEQIKKKALVA